MGDERKNTGKLAEDFATEYLKELGYEIIARNYQVSHLEIDIIARKDKYLVFVEVRSKSGSGYGSPEESMSASKRKQVRKAAEGYMNDNKHLNLQVRLDFIGVTFIDDKPKINHLINAF